MKNVAGRETGDGAVRLLEPGDRSALASFATDYRFKPYYYYGIDDRRLAEFFHRQLCARLGQDSCCVWATRDQVRGVITCDYLPWDSQLFDLPVAKVDLYVNGADYTEASTISLELLAKIGELCAEREIKLVTSRVNTQDVAALHALERHGFHLMDTIATFAIEPSQVSALAALPKTSVFVREARDEDLPYLSALSRMAFTNTNDIITRFSADPLLKDKAGDLYAEWLHNSLLGEQADIVFVAEVDARPVGFITCKLWSGEQVRGLGKTIGSIPLNAVDQAFRNLGIYTRLVVKSIDWFSEQGADYVELRTQLHTLAVHRTWQKLNGRLVNSYHSYHRGKQDTLRTNIG